MSDRGYIGAWQKAGQADRKPITAVDGILGIMLLLAYKAGGNDLFPEEVNAEIFIDEIGFKAGVGRVLKMDHDQLSGLVEAMAQSTGYHLKVLTSGSLKNYLSHFRNGKRPNGGTPPPRVGNSYMRNGDIEVHPRSFEADRATGEWDQVPRWVRLMVMGETA